MIDAALMETIQNRVLTVKGFSPPQAAVASAQAVRRIWLEPLTTYTEMM